jgi:hypothetical protein
VEDLRSYREIPYLHALCFIVEPCGCVGAIGRTACLGAELFTAIHGSGGQALFGQVLFSARGSSANGRRLGFLIDGTAAFTVG